MFVEAAFALTTIVSLLVGIFDVGQFLFVHQALVERARSAARWGAVNSPKDPGPVRNWVLYGSSSVPENGGGAAGYFGLTAGMVQVTTPGAGTEQARLVVLISNFPYRVHSPFIAGSYTGPNIVVAVPLGQLN